MAPVTRYVFAEMLGVSEHFTAGSHEWLPYSVIPTFPKLICKHQFISPLHCPQNNIPGGGPPGMWGIRSDKAAEEGGAVVVAGFGFRQDNVHMEHMANLFLLRCAIAFPLARDTLGSEEIIHGLGIFP